MKQRTPNYDLKWLRSYANLSQQEVADALKVNRVTYCNWERGETPTPKDALSILAKKLNVELSVIPVDLEGDLRREEEAVKFVADVAKLSDIPKNLVADTVAMLTTGERLPALPPIAIPLHQFRPSSMKRFNVPVERWVEYTQAKAGEDVAALRAAGYSWDQAVEWTGTEARAQAYALLVIWGEARDKHFQDRAARATAEKIAMPPLVYAEIVKHFDEMLEAKGWGLV